MSTMASSRRRWRWPGSGGTAAVRVPTDLATPKKVRRTSRVACLAVAVCCAVFPLVVTNPTYTSIGVFTLIFVAAAAAWNGFSGYSGYISLGNGIFYGAGAYTMALVSTHMNLSGNASMFALVPLAGVVGAALAVPVGLIALRTRRHTFVVLTIGLFFAFQLAAFNLAFTGGSAGVQLPLPNWTGQTYNNPFYYVAYGVAAFSALGFWCLRRSRLGLQLLAIRDDENRARGIGVQVLRVKLLDFTFAGFVTGMCGAMFAFFVGQIYPQFAFDSIFDVTIALMTFFGGIGTITGPLLGALVLEPVAQYLALGNVGGNQGYFIVYGAVFLVVLLLMPRGIVPMFRLWTERLFDRLAAREPRRVTAAETQHAEVQS